MFVHEKLFITVVCLISKAIEPGNTDVNGIQPLPLKEILSLWKTGSLQHSDVFNSVVGLSIYAQI